MNNPYAGVDWQRVLRVPSATHVHIDSQRDLDNGHRFGLRHFPISNYYPSAPYDAHTRPSDFRLRQSWGTTRQGAPIAPPIDWNEIITWRDELAEPYRSSLPFTEGPPVYSRVPGDIILSPNAEHHGFTDSDAHVCSPGSTFVSGNFDARGHYRLRDHGFPVGYGGPWREGFARMLAALAYADGGGITINHPTWFSQFTDRQVFDMLDFDDRVLGIEIYNDYSWRRDWSRTPNYKAPPEPAPGFSLNLWDRVLASGRRCWGLCVPDHSVAGEGNWRGRNVLLVPSFTERDCLRAYRDGRFYGCLLDNGLTVVEFAATESSIDVRVNAAARIRFIPGGGPATTIAGDHAGFKRPRKAHYVRVEIEDDSGERLFLQPVIYERLEDKPFHMGD